MALCQIEAEEEAHRQDIADSGDGIVIEAGRERDDDPDEPEDSPEDDGH